MSTETEVVLMSLTNDELSDVAWFNQVMLDRWRESRHVANETGRDELREGGVYRGTEGPFHAIVALDLAIVREHALRGGADPWYPGMSTVGHPAATHLRFYQERTMLNPDVGDIPRLSEAGILERVCPGCGASKPLTVRFWEWLGSMLALHCRTCRHTDWWTPQTPQDRRAARDERTALRMALVADEDAREAPPAPVEPITPDPIAEPDEEPAWLMPA